MRVTKNKATVVQRPTLIGSAVSVPVLENSRQGFDRFLSGSRLGKPSGNQEGIRVTDRYSYDFVSGDLFCSKHGFGGCDCKRENSVEFESYSYLPNDWRRIERTTGVGDKVDERFVSVYEGQDESHEYIVKTRKHGRGNDKNHEKGHCDWDNDRDDDRDDGCEYGPRCPHVAKDDLKLVRQFIGGPGMDDLEAVKYHGRELNMLKDGLGSTIALTNKGGNAVARVGYDAWGNLKFPDKNGYGVAPCGKKDLDELLDRLDGGRSLGGAQYDEWWHGRHFAKTFDPYLFAGRRFDSYSQLYQNRNRQYNSKYGRFISRDPIGFNGGNNLWGYAGNNPQTFVDPTGKSINFIVYNRNDWITEDLAKKLFRRIQYSDTILLPVDIFNLTSEVIDEIKSWARIDTIDQMHFIGHGLDPDPVTGEPKMNIEWYWDVAPNIFGLGYHSGKLLTCDYIVPAKSTYFFGCQTEGMARSWHQISRGNTYGTNGYPLGFFGSVLAGEFETSFDVTPKGNAVVQTNRLVVHRYSDILDFFIRSKMIVHFP